MEKTYEEQVQEYISWMETLSSVERIEVLLEDFGYKIEVVRRTRDAGQTFQAGCAFTHAYPVLYREVVTRLPERWGGGEAVSRVDVITNDPNADRGTLAGELIDGFLPVSLFADAVQPHCVDFDDGSGILDTLIGLGL
jgi:hypothetical protein